jgi:hypothetical protein
MLCIYNVTRASCIGVLALILFAILLEVSAPRHDGNWSYVRMLITSPLMRPGMDIETVERIASPFYALDKNAFPRMQTYADARRLQMTQQLKEPTDRPYPNNYTGTISYFHHPRYLDSLHVTFHNGRVVSCETFWD